MALQKQQYHLFDPVSQTVQEMSPDRISAEKQITSHFSGIQMVSAFVIQRLLIIGRTVRDCPDGERNSDRLPI
jgi:hypothetical protein